MDYEKLGLFYLGKQYDIQARARTDVPVLYDSSDLVTHAVIVGMTGSGKTGLGIDLMEEAAIDGIPVLAVDPKGDLANLLLTFPGLSGAEFAPWVNQDEARAAGQTPEAYGAAEAAKWAKGLADWGQDGERITRLKGAADFVVYTPGSTMGRPVSIVESFAAPPASVVDDPDLLGDRVSTAATSVLTLAGVDAEPLRSREHVLVSTLFADAWKAGQDMDLAGLIGAVQNPPIERIGVMDLEAFFPAKDRFTLAMQLNQLLAAPSFAAWLQGDPLDIDAMLYTPEGKPRVAVVSIAHLDDHERMFFVSLLLNELVAWMRAQRGTSSLRALVYFDEIFGFLPPVANPPSKAPLLKLLKQARAFGVGLTLATQNPVDLDYKALSNCGTWMLGRLQTERDKARVLDGLEGVAASSGEGFDRAALDQLLSSLGKRIFLLHNVHEKHPVVFETRWTLSYLRGPMGRDEIRRLCGSADAASRATVSDSGVARPPQSPADSVPSALSAPSAAPAPSGLSAPSAAPAPSALSASSAAPVLDPQIKQLFIPSPAGSVLSPSVLGVARVSYSDAKLGIDETRDVALVTPIADGAVAVDWEHAEPASFDVDHLETRPPAGVAFAPLPAAAARARSYAAWETAFARWAGQTQAIELLRSVRAKVTSAPDESERAFRIRVTEAMHEGRDAALEKVRAKHAAKIRTAEDKVRRAQAAVERESQQAAESKVSTAVSFGATVLGALLGRKAVSASTLGRATTAAKGMGRMSREAADVARAEANVEALTQQLADLQAALEAEMQAVGQQWDPATDELERVVVKPKRGGVSVQLFGLVWQPH
ncbi:MAG: ATP-binding protein [Acidobacteria bacterium]|nr:ATP-binding protein [Acidobacteriota bacterium]